MQVVRKRLVTAIAFLLIMLSMAGQVAAQAPKSLLAKADGDGAFKVGGETFKITTVIVKLLEDGTAELNFISDMTIFMQGTWTGGDDIKAGIQLKIVGGVTRSGLDGGGKLFLREDGKSIASLALQVTNKSTKRNIEIRFVAK